MKTKLDKWLYFTHLQYSWNNIAHIYFIKNLLNQNSNVLKVEVKEWSTLNICWTCKNQHLIAGSHHTVTFTTLTIHGVRHLSLLASVRRTNIVGATFYSTLIKREGAAALARAGAKLCTQYTAPRTRHRELRGPYQSTDITPHFDGTAHSVSLHHIAYVYIYTIIHSVTRTLPFTLYGPTQH
jgi:hypothetical protein